MKRRILSIVAIAIATLLSGDVAGAQSRLCFTVDHIPDEPGLRVYAGDRFDLTADGTGEPSHITGDVKGTYIEFVYGRGLFD